MQANQLDIFARYLLPRAAAYALANRPRPSEGLGAYRIRTYALLRRRLLAVAYLYEVEQVRKLKPFPPGPWPEFIR